MRSTALAILTSNITDLIAINSTLILINSLEMNRNHRLSDPKFEVKQTDCRNILAIKKMNNLCDGFEMIFLNLLARCTDDFAERLVSLILKH